MPSLATMKKQQSGGDLPALLDKFKSEIARALPKHLNADRMARIALTEFRKNPALQACDPRSIFASVILASQNGLEPGVMGQGYLIPYRTECQFVPGWKGLVDLTNRTGRATVWTGAVFEGDEFFWQLGDTPKIEHRPGGESDPNKMTHVYAVGRVRGSEWPVIECWPIERVWAHRDRFNKVGDRHYSYKHPEMYARKVVLLQVLKYMPASIEMQQVMDLDQAAEHGRQSIDMMQAATGEWIPPVVEETQETEHLETDPVPSHQPASASASRPAPAPDSATQNVHSWPRQNEDEEWVDKANTIFDPEKHVWDDDAEQPLIYKRGRLSGQFQKLPDVEPSEPATSDNWNLE